MEVAGDQQHREAEEGLALRDLVPVAEVENDRLRGLRRRGGRSARPGAHAPGAPTPDNAKSVLVLVLVVVGSNTSRTVYTEDPCAERKLVQASRGAGSGPRARPPRPVSPITASSDLGGFQPASQHPR